MSGQMNKIKTSKQRMRRKLASLPVADKLRIVEKLHDETILPLPSQEDNHIETEEREGKLPNSLLMEMIQRTVEKQHRGREIVSGSDDEKRLAAEVENVFAQRTRGMEALSALFPEGLSASSAFFERLTDLEMRLGWGEVSHRATGLLLLLAVEQLPADSGEALLRQMPRIGNPDFFQALDTLSVLLADWELRPAFAAEWFPALVRRIGNDLASGGFWKALDVYCEQHAQNALEALRCLSTGQSEDQISVAAYILGVLRSLELDRQTSAQLKRMEADFSNSTTIAIRSIYNRSWIQTAFCGKIQKADLEALTSRMSAGVSDEREQVFWIVCRSLLSPLIPEECFNFGLGWLRANAAGTIAPASKYNIIDFTARLPATRREVAAELVLLVQPISAEHTGIWQRLEHFLVAWLKADLEGFSHFSVELARRNALNWLVVLKAPQSFDWFLSELRGKDVGNLVGQLVLSRMESCRRLGLLLFGELEMSALPPSMLDTVGESRVRVAFYELQRGLVHGAAIGRYLILLIPCVQKASPDFQNEFYDELVLQLKNYAGSCRKECERRAGEFPILKRAIEQVDHYFEALRKVRQSSINAIEVAGYRQGVRLSARRFTNAISKGSEEASVFMSLFKKVRLLYGKTWSSFNDGKLGEASGLQEISSSVEIPRLEEIDPEGMALRRLYASAKILELSKSDDATGEGANG